MHAMRIDPIRRKCIGLWIRYGRLRIVWVFVALFATPYLVGAEDMQSAEARAPLVPRNVQFSRFSVAEGLAQGAVNAIAQDNYGFMWFGTQEGLNRYDGYEFGTYQHDPEDPGSLSHNWVWTLLVDRDGDLWVGTDGGGLSLFQRETQSFRHYRHDPTNPGSLSHDRVRVVYQDAKGTLWVGTDGGGLNRLDATQGEFVQYRHDPEDPFSLPNDSVLAILEDREGTLWVGTDGGGLARLDPTRGAFFPYRHDPSRPNSLSNDRVRTIYEDRDGRLWIGTYEGGVNLLDVLNGSFRRFQPDGQDYNSLSHNRVRDIYQDRRGTLWVATDAGLNEWRADAQRFVRYLHDPTDTSSISDDRVISIFEDRGGVLWVGTYSGLNKWNFLSDAFTYYRTEDGAPFRLSSKVVTAIAESASGMIWVGTYGGGLNRLDLASGSVREYRHDPADAESLSDDRVMAVFVDRQGIVWIGTRGKGLDRLDPSTGKVRHYRQDASAGYSLSADGVTSLFGDLDGTLWVGTYGGGLNRLEPQTGEITVFRHDPEDDSSLSSDRVLAIYRDRSGGLWVGTEGGGLNRFAEDTLSFLRYRHSADNAASLGSDNAWEILEGTDGSLWVGTLGGGLNRWMPKDRAAGRAVFRRYRQRDGLISDTVFGILEDENGALWMSSNRGLSKFDPDNGSIRHFDRRNGLKSDEFNFAARLRSRTGQMFFGGPEGLVRFHPAQVGINLHRPPIAVAAYSKLALLAKAHSAEDLTVPIELGYREDYIAFEFAALDYASPDKNQYRFRLEGFDEDWFDPGGFRRATYTNLAAGRYTFKVQASNNDGVWTEQGISIGLRVVPAPWKTGWAYASYVTLALGIVGLYLRAQSQKFEREAEQRRELEHQVRLRTGELAQRNRDLVALNSKLAEASVTDSLTSLKNRRYLDQYLESEIALVDRHAGKDRPEHGGERMSSVNIPAGLFFMMIDLDGFKAINDTFGHHAGDRALVQVRDILQACCRHSDTIIRWGGDEFLIVGRSGGPPTMEENLAERIRVALAEHQYTVGDGHIGRLSGSIGFTRYPFAPLRPQLLSWEQVIDVADHAAYISKENGRNAWVGIHCGRKGVPEDLATRIQAHFEALLERGVVTLNTSIDRELDFAQRKQQAKA